MALTNTNINMIRAITEGDLHGAKMYALNSLKEDKSKKNEWATSTMIKKLSASGLSVGESIPADIKLALVGWSGFDPAKYYIRQTEAELCEQIIKMSIMADRLAEMGVEYRNTALLYGQTGTGKTEFARYLAYKLNKPLFYVNFSECINSYMGKTAQNINKIISWASQWPCILLLDEIDCIALKRHSGKEGPDGELSRVTVSVMQALDAMPSYVTLIACTNKPDMLDDALMRRFSIKYEMKEMSDVDLRFMARQYLEATDTSDLLTAEVIEDMVKRHNTPGELMPELIRSIANAYYRLHEKELMDEAAKEAAYTDMWDVMSIYAVKVGPCETEAEAIAEAKKIQNGFKIHTNAGQTVWKAKRIETQTRRF